MADGVPRDVVVGRCVPLCCDGLDGFCVPEIDLQQKKTRNYMLVAVHVETLHKLHQIASLSESDIDVIFMWCHVHEFTALIMSMRYVFYYVHKCKCSSTFRDVWVLLYSRIYDSRVYRTMVHVFCHICDFSTHFG